MGKYHVSIEDSTPEEYRDQVELWLETSIDFLTSIPRPQSKSLPAIETLIPDFSEIKFSVGDHFCPPHGLFSRTKWTGYCVLPVRDNGDLILQTEPHLTLFMDQDVALASMTSWVHLLDQMFVVYKEPKQHLARQIQFLEKFHPELHKRFIKERNAARSKAQRARNRQNFKRRNVVKQNKTQLLPTMTSPLSQPKQNLNSSGFPPMNPRHVPIQKPVTTPDPVLSEYQRKVVAEHQAMWDCVRDRAESSSCEDFDK